MAKFARFKEGNNTYLWLTSCFAAFFIFGIIAMPATIQAQQRSAPMYIMNADGTDLHELVHLEDHECTGSPTWTRDGEHILFDAWRKKESFRESHIYIVNADGTWPVDLGQGAMPSVMHEKSHGLATHYYGDRQGVWLGMKEPILVDSDAGSPRWHPYESKLAYVKWGGGIMVREIVGSKIGQEDVLVPAEHHPYVGFSWSPDGKSIAFYSNRLHDENRNELLVMNVTDPKNNPVVKATGPIGWIVSWSPDGEKIAFEKTSEETKMRQIYVVDAASFDTPYPLKGQDPMRHNYSPAWSPDGKRIVFTSKAAAKKTEQ